MLTNGGDNQFVLRSSFGDHHKSAVELAPIAYVKHALKGIQNMYLCI